MKKNEIHRVTIEGYASDGSGVARMDGMVVFVRGALRGEDCDILILKVLKTMAYAKIVRLHKASPHRRESACPYFGQCGGCVYWHMDYAEELRVKEETVRDALSRIGGQEVGELPVLGSAAVEGYRNKAQYPIAPSGEIGFYRARSHDVVPVAHCRIQSAAAERISAAVGAWMRRAHVSAYEERTRRGLLRHLYIRTARDGSALVCLVAARDAVPAQDELIGAVRSAWEKTVGILINVQDRPNNVILGEHYRLLWGKAYLEDTLCGVKLRLSPASFYQVNRAQAERLYRQALEFAELTGREEVLELYCGIGAITLAAAPHARHVTGAEIVPAAVRDARENAARNGIENVTFHCADAAEIAERYARQGIRPDVVLVDPPRKGLSEAARAAVARIAAPRIVYISCNAATLARDIRCFADDGYTLRRSAVVDLFPRTRHVECVVLMSRVGR